jgi:hypothetical protein
MFAFLLEYENVKKIAIKINVRIVSYMKYMIKLRLNYELNVKSIIK